MVDFNPSLKTVNLWNNNYGSTVNDVEEEPHKKEVKPKENLDAGMCYISMADPNTPFPTGSGVAQNCDLNG